MCVCVCVCVCVPLLFLVESKQTKNTANKSSKSLAILGFEVILIRQDKERVISHVDVDGKERERAI